MKSKNAEVHDVDVVVVEIKIFFKVEFKKYFLNVQAAFNQVEIAGN